MEDTELRKLYPFKVRLINKWHQYEVGHIFNYATIDMHPNDGVVYLCMVEMSFFNDFDEIKGVAISSEYVELMAI